MELPVASEETGRDRASGVLLHPTSLPGRGGIGDLGRGTRGLLDWLVAAGQTAWQILPITEPGAGASPYGALSSFAGNRRLLCLSTLVEEGLLAADEVGAPPVDTSQRVDFQRVTEWKDAALRRAWSGFRERGPTELARRLEDFTHHDDNRGWLGDWSLYAALKDRFDGAAWNQWPAGLRSRDERALIAARSELRQEIDFQVFLQFLFYRQWSEIHRRARRRGIRIIGDLPIYPAADSADVWANQELFDLDEEGKLNACAGVPPDYFSPTGQRWGNPLYRWDRLQERNFDWWIRRVGFLLRHVDEIRLDHFRGFASFWRVPAEAEDARQGEWVEAPGAALFSALQHELRSLPLIAEDLGVITPDVDGLRRRFAMPGMRVLQFGFDSLDSLHLPHNHTPDSVVYTGTHDNDTIRGWFGGLSPTSRRRVNDYLGADERDIHWSLIRAALGSVGRLAVIPMQDLLGLDGRARMNTPGQPHGNWSWRITTQRLDTAPVARLRRLTEICGRLGSPVATEGRSSARPLPAGPVHGEG